MNLIPFFSLIPWLPTVEEQGTARGDQRCPWRHSRDPALPGAPTWSSAAPQAGPAHCMWQQQEALVCGRGITHLKL